AFSLQLNLSTLGLTDPEEAGWCVTETCESYCWACPINLSKAQVPRAKQIEGAKAVTPRSDAHFSSFGMTHTEWDDIPYT
ncbi:hypothetical protein P7M07_23435, partial [Vibrio parahaemolyticus]|nr:hypothetical protein [Vibrio parahaemolyticus]